MSRAMQSAQGFQAKLEEKIRESIGDLIDQDALRELVAAGAQKLLFEKRVRKKTGSWSPEEWDEPLMQEILTPLLEEEIQKAVRHWMEENREKIEKDIRAFVTNGADAAVLRALRGLLGPELEAFERRMHQLMPGGSQGVTGDAF